MRADLGGHPFGRRVICLVEHDIGVLAALGSRLNGRGFCGGSDTEARTH